MAPMSCKKLMHLCLLLLGAEVVSQTPEPLRVAWLAPKQEALSVSAASSMGGLVLGIEEVQNDTTLLSTDTFEVRWEDSACQSKASLAAMYELLINTSYDPHVILGPPCSDAMQYVGLLAATKDIPILGWVADNTMFQDKKAYSSLIRTLPPVNAIGRALSTTLLHFDWRVVELIASTDDTYQKLGSGVQEALTSENISVIRYVDNADGLDPDLESIKVIYEKLKEEARIVILCVPLDTLRSWMLVAHDQGMTDGDYAFVFINGQLPTGDLVAEITAKSFWERGDGQDDKARQAYESLLIFSMQSENVTTATKFKEKADAAADKIKWKMMLGLSPSSSDKYSGFLHDALMLYATLADEEKKQSGNYTSGATLLDRAKSREFTGPEWVTGTMLLDEKGDRMPVFYLFDMSADDVFHVAQITNPSINAVTKLVVMDIDEVEEIIWGNGQTGDGNKPKDIPDCGYTNEKCPDHTLVIALSVSIGVVVILATIGFVVYRKYQFEKSLSSMSWKLLYEDLKGINNKGIEGSALLRLSRASSLHRSHLSGLRPPSRAGSAMIRKSCTSVIKGETCSNSSEDEGGQVFINTAHYKGAVVAVKNVRKQRIKIDRGLLMEMRNMTNIKHNNMATFIGATVELPHFCEVWEYYSKGSLQDVIWNENINLDDMFKYSISIDIFKGLKYLHDSPLKVHGRLKSSNVVVDGRWVCKLMDYGLNGFRDGQREDPEITHHKRYSRLFWTAPELLGSLDTTGWPSRFTQEGDIYSATVIIKEVFAGNGPYTEFDEIPPADIIEKVKAGPKNYREKPFRPSLSEIRLQGSEKLTGLIKQGWAEEESDRPSAKEMVKELQRINPSKSTNVMDNMIKMMERYNTNLEGIVGERTQQVEEEKKKSEVLLFRMLPKYFISSISKCKIPVAEDLKAGHPIKAEQFEAVTIYFSDIVKFTNLSAQSTPMQVVNLLNKLYTIWDSTIAEHDVYKVETIGDAYMVVSGVPIRNGDNHAVEIANTAMDLLSGIIGFKVEHMPDYTLRIRIGLHTGPAVAGVVGLTMPRYCLFGSTVNTAAMFEAGGSPMRIHISETTYKILSKFSGYHIADRGSDLDCKRGGKFHSYWLMGRDGYKKPWPDFDELAAEDDPKPVKFPVTSGRRFRSSISRPSQESGIFDVVEPNDIQMLSRKSSYNEEAQQKKLENIEEHNSESQILNKEERAKGSGKDENEPNKPSESIREQKTAPEDRLFEQGSSFPPAGSALGLKREKTLEIQDIESEDNTPRPYTPKPDTPRALSPIPDSQQEDPEDQEEREEQKEHEEHGNINWDDIEAPPPSHGSFKDAQTEYVRQETLCFEEEEEEEEDVTISADPRRKLFKRIPKISVNAIQPAYPPDDIL